MCSVPDNAAVNGAETGVFVGWEYFREPVWNARGNVLESVSNVRLFCFKAVGPTKKDLFPRVFMFVDGSQKMKLSEDEGSPWQGLDHTLSITFRHLPPNSARFSYATEGALFISAHPPQVKRKKERKKSSVSIQTILVLFELA